MSYKDRRMLHRIEALKPLNYWSTPTPRIKGRIGSHTSKPLVAKYYLYEG